MANNPNFKTYPSCFANHSIEKSKTVFTMSIIVVLVRMIFLLQKHYITKVKFL